MRLIRLFVISFTFLSVFFIAIEQSSGVDVREKPFISDVTAEREDINKNVIVVHAPKDVSKVILHNHHKGFFVFFCFVDIFDF